MKAIFLFICFHCIFLNLKAQQQEKHYTIYFNSAVSSVDHAGDMQLTKIADSLKAKRKFKITATGNTDNAGSDAYNMILSGKRAAAVKQFFTGKGMDPEKITVLAKGEADPADENETDQGRMRNRRVEILISSPVPNAIGDLYKLLEREPEKFCINNKRDTIIRCKMGSLVLIKANTFPVNDPGKNQCVTILIKQDLKKSDMIMDRLSTMSFGKILETEGMIYTEARDCDGKTIPPAKDLVIMIPADKINPDAGFFYGQHDPHHDINWVPDLSTKMMNCNIDDLNRCPDLFDKPGNAFRDKVLNNDDCKKCRFLFCRVARLDNALAGTFSSNVHAKNIKFRECQRTFRPLKKVKPSKNTNTANAGKPVPLAGIDTCEALRRLLKQYDITDPEMLKMAMNKKLLDSLQITTLSALVDTMDKIKRRQIEVNYLNKKISYADLKYYVFNTRREGWSNVDCFSRMDPSKLVNQPVNVKDDEPESCDYKLVFTERKVIMPFTGSRNNFGLTEVNPLISFSAVPKGERATIVALKYEDGKPFLAMQEILLSDKVIKLEYHEMTLQQLKEKLKFLDGE